MWHKVLALLTVGLFWDVALAKDNRVYLLGEPGTFVDIKKQPEKTSGNEMGLLMRDPNLAGDGVKIATKPQPKPAKIAKIQPPKPKKSAVLFKPLRVAGSVRMPRVEFGRVTLPVGLRDESPNLNFSDRDLLDRP